MSDENPNRRIWIYVIPISTIFAIVLLLFFSIRMNRNSVPETIDDNRFLLDTVVSIRLYDSGQYDVLENAFTLIEDYDKQLSRYKKESEISQINAAPAGTPIPVSGTTRKLIRKGIQYARLSGGTFDPTVGPLVTLWGIGGEDARIPGSDEIKAALTLINPSGVIIDDVSGTVTLEREGMALDLGGIAKGWIADRTAEYLLDSGENHILINLGGNVLVSGGKPSGEPYRIGMQDPFDDRGRYLGIFTLEDGSVVSSGIYERFFESSGIRYHHILSTVDGYPIKNDLAAVTIISANSVDGDALSTSVFALGLDDGLELVMSLDGIEAAFITLEGRVIMTKGAADRFEASDSGLQLEVRDE